MNMKRLLLLICMMGLFGNVIAVDTDDTIEFSDIQTTGTRNYFDVTLRGSRIYNAYNMDIYLPDGIDVTSVVRWTGDGVYPYTEETQIDDETGEEKTVKTYSHTITYNMPSQHLLRLMCVSLKSEEFLKMEGRIFRVWVNVDQRYLSTKPVVRVEAIDFIVREGAVDYKPADIICRPFNITASRRISVNVLSDNKIGTLILPFEAALPEGLSAYSCSSMSEDKLVLTKATILEALKPYILYAPAGYSGTLEGTVTTSPEDYPEESVTEGLLTGLVVSKQLSNGYILQNQGNGAMFYDARGVNFTLPAGRCYLNNIGGEVKAFGFLFEEADAVRTLRDAIEETEQDVIYDLTGRKNVANRPGLYIREGRKYVVQ